MTSPSPVSGWEAERERLRKALERIKLIANDRSDPAGFRLGMISDEANYALSESKEQTTADGWIEWRGGECPVLPGTYVKVRLASGYQDIDRADSWDWNRTEGALGTIVAYRVMP